jgi:hypothetical protein
MLITFMKYGKNNFILNLLKINLLILIIMDYESLSDDNTSCEEEVIKQRYNKNKPNIMPQIMPHIKPQIMPHIKPQIIPHIKPQIIPHIKPQIMPNIRPKIIPNINSQIISNIQKKPVINTTLLLIKSNKKL